MQFGSLKVREKCLNFVLWVCYEPWFMLLLLPVPSDSVWWQGVHGCENLPRVTRDWRDCKSAVLRLCHLAALKFPLLLHYTYLTASSRPTRVSQYQKGTASMDLNESGDDGVLGYTGISWTICKQSVPRSRQPHQHLSTEFLQAGCSSWHPANSVRALKTLSTEGISTIDNRA